MATNHDARPFVDLKKDAQEFRMKFDEDIKECLNSLDAKITTLICDPDSFGATGRSVHQNALAEFSKAKYDIFIGVKTLINAKEREWLNYIGEMKKLFIENVEIFLAGTKLEVKLPPSESAPSHGSRKSPGNCKSNSAFVTSSIYPILSSITKNIPVLGSSLRENDASNVILKANVGDKTQFNRRGRLSTSSIKLAFSPYLEEEMDVEESQLDNSQSRSSSNTRSRNLSNSGLNTSRSNSGRRSSLKNEMNLGLKEKNTSVLEKQSDIHVSESGNSYQYSSKVRARRGKLIKNNSCIAVVQSNSSSTDENENQTIETTVKEIPLKGRRGRSALKAKTTNVTVVAQNNSGSTDENEGRIIETVENEVPLKGRRGRLTQKAKANNVTVVAQSNSSSTDENDGTIIETVENEVPLKGRRGISTQKTKATKLAVKEVVKSVVHRSRPVASKNVPDQKIVQKTSGRGRKAVKPVVEEEIYEPGPSKSPKKVSFSGDHSSSEELDDIQPSIVRPVKSVSRRKTLLPNLEDLSGVDIIPGNPSRSKAKRKTIGVVSEFETVAPSKRLKSSKKTISSQEEDSNANNNLLESDGNYSDWMSLKSIDGKIPTQPAIYEVKVWRAKKTAYIGSCENLRQKLTLYNLRQNSGHKHLDKFIDRNYNEIQVRFEIISSFGDAKQEVKSRIDSFKAQHKNPPAYN